MTSTTGTLGSSRSALGAANSRPQLVRNVSGLSTHDGHSILHNRVSLLTDASRVAGKKIRPFVAIGPGQLDSSEKIDFDLSTINLSLMQTFKATTTTAKFGLRARCDGAVAAQITMAGVNTCPVFYSQAPVVFPISGGNFLGDDPVSSENITFQVTDAGVPTPVVITFKAARPEIPASVAESYDVTGSNFTFVINGGAPVNYTPPVANHTASALAALINAAVPTLNCYDDGGLLTFRNLIGGTGKSLQITNIPTVSGTPILAATPTSVISGVGNIADSTAITFAEIKARFDSVGTYFELKQTQYGIINYQTMPPVTAGNAGYVYTLSQSAGAATLFAALDIDPAMMDVGSAVYGVTDALDPTWENGGSLEGSFSQSSPGHDGATGHALTMSYADFAAHLTHKVRYGGVPGEADDFASTAFGATFVSSASLTRGAISFWAKVGATALGYEHIAIGLSYDDSGQQSKTVQVPIHMPGEWEFKIVPMASFGLTPTNLTNVNELFFNIRAGLALADVSFDLITLHDEPSAAIFSVLVDLGTSLPGDPENINIDNLAGTVDWSADTTLYDRSVSIRTPGMHDILLQTSWGIETPLVIDRYYGLVLIAETDSGATLSLYGSTTDIDADHRLYSTSTLALSGAFDFDFVPDTALYFQVYSIPDKWSIGDFRAIIQGSDMSEEISEGFYREIFTFCDEDGVPLKRWELLQRLPHNYDSVSVYSSSMLADQRAATAGTTELLEVSGNGYIKYELLPFDVNAGTELTPATMLSTEFLLDYLLEVFHHQNA